MPILSSFHYFTILLSYPDDLPLELPDSKDTKNCSKFQSSGNKVDEKLIILKINMYYVPAVKLEYLLEYN